MMNDILVWKNYGQLDIYDVSTPEKLYTRIKVIIECVCDTLDTDSNMCAVVERVEDHINKNSDNKFELRRAFNTLVNEINPSWDYNCFEELYITELK